MNAQQGSQSTWRNNGYHDLEDELATAQQQLAAIQADLAASEASRRDLAEQLRSKVGHAWSRPSRWRWASCSVWIILGVVVWSLALGAAGTTQVRLDPHVPSLVVPALAAEVVANRGADAEWPAIVRELDGTWEQDWPRTIAVLETFLGRWPGYTAAEGKLYAALVADSDVRIQSGQVDTGVAELERAARLLPQRAEAWARLAGLATSGQT